MRRLLPVPEGPADGGPETESDIDLEEAYAYPAHIVAAGRPWLRANMVTSLDGAAQAGDGLSAGLSSPADKRIFGVLRGLADVVIVGASTVRAEGYRPPQPKPAYAPARVAAGRNPVPVIAIVSRSLALDLTAPLFTEAVVPTVVLTGPDADPERLAAARKAADVIIAGAPGTSGVDPGAAVDALAARGWTRMLTEGGPHLLGQLLESGRLDELCLALSPQLAGGTATRMTVASPAVPAAGGGTPAGTPAGAPVGTPTVSPIGSDGKLPQSMELHTLLEEDGFLFARYVRNINS
ncbi:pyrimidine reductase family protein [Yinghuangia seranimata]|uniref:pyrimidine reductase family protein n=1 Tax=Yinghuangia seranimata TaxID=408067 RepID=UPI00248CC915|nr:pyrimidine reductase family protein [Yinghuangia seranimata]MDI2125131.1 pyrimidine reductase family protein [Yinghuangia seranimata]